MKVAAEIGNSNTYWNLNQSKIFALLEVPKEEREEYKDTNLTSGFNWGSI